MNMIMKILPLVATLFPDLHWVYLDPRIRVLISECDPPFGCVVCGWWSHLWHKASRIWVLHSHAEIPQSMRWSFSHPRVVRSVSAVSVTVDEDQFIPAAWIQAARWSACASAPPSCPCSSDSLSSAAESLPVSDTLRTHHLTSAQRRTDVTFETFFVSRKSSLCFEVV